jgi:DNA-binding HxlR family transcriptional regulator
VQCPVAQTSDVIGDAWTMLIVRDAFWGVTRFEDFRRSLGVPRATLSARLASLVDDGVLAARPYGASRFEYQLTDKGRALRPVLVAMLQWGNEWSTMADDPLLLVDRDSGEVVTPTVVDEATGRRLDQIRLARRRRSDLDGQRSDRHESVGERVDVVDG